MARKKENDYAYKYGKIKLDADFCDKNGNLFGSPLLPSTRYEARLYIDDKGVNFVYPALREDAALLVVDDMRSTARHQVYCLPVYNQNKANERWMPCVTGSYEGCISYIQHINKVDRVILEQLLAIPSNEWYATGYTISHWVFTLDSKGILKTVEGALKSPKAQCAITGYQSATWTLAHKPNGTTIDDENSRLYGARVGYVATGFMPIDSENDITMSGYHSSAYGLAEAVGDFTSTNPTAKGFEIEGNFFENIGRNDWNMVNTCIFDKVYYEKLYLNRRGVMATLLLKTYRFRPIITADCTVHWELLLRPCTSLNAIKDNLCALSALIDTQSAFGSHIHISVIDDTLCNLFSAYDYENDTFTCAQDLFMPLIEELKNDVENTIKVFGRYFGQWAGMHVGCCDHSSAINITPYGTIEFRLSKYQNELQYLRLINMACEMAQVLHAYMESLYGNKALTLKDAQDKVMAIWNKTKDEKTRTDDNAKKSPNKEGVRHRNRD